MVTPILTPVKDPGPFTTIISLTSLGEIRFSFRMSSIYLTTYIERSLEISL